MELAQRVAENFFLTQSPSKSILSMQVSRWGDREQPTLYAFSLSDCWVLVSGDKRTQPILAYSEQKSQKFPSAEEMQQDGVNMNQLQIQLLKKIEELTLYIIKQEERIKELEVQLKK